MYTVLRHKTQVQNYCQCKEGQRPAILLQYQDVDNQMKRKNNICKHKSSDYK